MKRLVALFATVVACAAVFAGTSSASGGPEVLARGFACGLFDGNGSGMVTYNSSLTLYANDQGAKLVLRCEGNGAGAPSLRFFNYANTGFLCGVIYGATTDWSNKVGRNGNSQLTCTLQLNGDQIAPDGGSAGIG